MAQSFAMECPATPERVDQCPATPDFVRRPIKSPENTSSSDESTFHNHSRTATGSPPPNCAICLGKCKNKCFTDSCLHQFCFKCLLEWSKVKAECPLCKQSFKSIIHNVKSDDQFEEYLVQSPPNSFPDFSRPMRAHIQIPSRNSFSATMQLHPNTLSNSIIQLRSEVTTRFRRYVYDGGLYALPLPDVTGRFRECSARFYIENISQVHRLMPWLNRELVCLLRDTVHSTSTVLCMIHDLLTIFNISSPDFRRRIAPYLGHHIAHFIHEFLNFARSPYDMIGYDREVRYSINSIAEVTIPSSSDSDDIAEIGGESPQFSNGLVHNNRRPRNNNNNTVGLTIETPNNPHSAISTVHIIIGDGDSNGSNNSNINILNIPNQSSSSQLTAINLSTNNNSSPNPNNDTVNRNESELFYISESNEISQQINEERISLHSSASSDTCEFVLERKPPHLRTPEMVSLNSDSDSDVVFVSEQKRTEGNNDPTPGTSGISFSIGRQTRLKSGRLIDNIGIFTPSSEVNQSSDSDFKPSLEIKKNRPRILRSRQTERVLKDEFNAIASTSSGITGSGKPMSLLYSSSSSRNKRKHTSKSKSSENRDRPCSGRGYKAIYESSSTSDSDSSKHESDDDDEDDGEDNSTSNSDEKARIKSILSNSLLNSSRSSGSCSSNRSRSTSSNTNNDSSAKHKIQKNLINDKESEESKTNRSIKKTRKDKPSCSSSGSDSSLHRRKDDEKKMCTIWSSSTSSDRSTNSNSINIHSNKKHYESIRQNRLEKYSCKKNKLKSKSKHSTRKEIRKHSKNDKNSKDTKKYRSKSKSHQSSKKKDRKNKKFKDRKRKRRLSSKPKLHAPTEFSESDVEPLSKHLRTMKSEFPLNENDFDQEQNSTSFLLCFPIDIHMPMNLSTTEQIQNEPPSSLLLENIVQENLPTTSEE